MAQSSWRPSRPSIALRSAVALFAAILVIQLGVSDRSLIRQDTSFNGERFGPSSDDAVLRADRALQAGNPEAAERLAILAIDRSPLNADALEVLAMAREDQGRDAGPFLQAAAALGWRNIYAQTWAIDAAVDRGDLGGAVLRADALLRQGARDDELISLLRRLAGNARGRAALVGRLANDPPWRQRYTIGLKGLTPQGFAAHEAVLEQLRASNSPVRADEAEAYVARLVADQRYGQALAVWKRFNPQAQGSLINDPSFARLDLRGGGSAFGWRGLELPGIYLEIAAAPGKPRAGALSVRAERTVSGPVLEQTLVLPGSTYDLSFERRVGRNELPEALEWNVTCLGGAGRVVIDQPRSARAGAEWALIRQKIRIPKQDCPAQRAALRVHHTGVEPYEFFVRQVQLHPSKPVDRAPD